MNISRRNFFSLLGATAVAAALPAPLMALASGPSAVPAQSREDMLFMLMRSPQGRELLAQSLTKITNQRLDRRRRYGRRNSEGGRLPMALKPGEEIPYEYALNPTVYIFEANASIIDIKERRFDPLQAELFAGMDALIENEHELYRAARMKGEGFVPMPVEIVSNDDQSKFLVGFEFRQQYAIRD